MNKAVIRQTIPILLAVGLLYYVLKDVPLAELVAQFRQADYRWLLVAAAVMGLFQLTRAARWQLTLQALGYRPSLFRTTVALLAGTLASMVVPGAGELTRCGTLQRTDGVPLAKGIGSVVAERVIDLLMLTGLVGLTLLLEFDRVAQYMRNLLARFVGFQHTVLLLVGGLAVAVLLLLLAGQILRNRGYRSHPLVVRVLIIGRDIGTGFMGIRQLKRPVLFVGLTLLSNGLSFLTTYVLFFATAQTHMLPPSAALTILTVSSLGGLAVPTQGGLGTYHFLVSRVLMGYGMTETEGVITATFLHAVQTGFSLLLSSVSFLLVPWLLRQRAKQEEKRLV